MNLLCDYVYNAESSKFCIEFACRQAFNAREEYVNFPNVWTRKLTKKSAANYAHEYD